MKFKNLITIMVIGLFAVSCNAMLPKLSDAQLRRGSLPRKLVQANTANVVALPPINPADTDTELVQLTLPSSLNTLRTGNATPETLVTRQHRSSVVERSPKQQRNSVLDRSPEQVVQLPVLVSPRNNMATPTKQRRSSVVERSPKQHRDSVQLERSPEKDRSPVSNRSPMQGQAVRNPFIQFKQSEKDLLLKRSVSTYLNEMTYQLGEKIVDTITFANACMSGLDGETRQDNALKNLSDALTSGEEVASLISAIKTTNAVKRHISLLKQLNTTITETISRHLQKYKDLCDQTIKNIEVNDGYIQELWAMCCEEATKTKAPK